MIKHNFTDYTFIIPFHYDIPDRLENINLAIDYLYNHVDTTIYVKEMGETRYFDFSKHSDKRNFIYEYKNERFSKTKLINNMVSNIHTPLFSIHDTDAFLSINQYEEVLKLFTIDIIDCIIPYNGTYMEIPRTSISHIKNNIVDICELDNTGNLRFAPVDYKGTGCCAFFRTKTFNKIGGMNENFTRWGFEDDEVVYRFFGTGHNIIWLNDSGPVHHLIHGHSEDGFGFDHNHDKGINQKEEYITIKSMGLYDLWEYIKSWKT